MVLTSPTRVVSAQAAEPLGQTSSVHTLDLLSTADLSDRRLEEIQGLLLTAFDGAFSEEDWEHTLGGWHVVISDGAVIAHAAVVARVLHVEDRQFRTGYVEGVATAPVRQREGLGSQAMAAVAGVLLGEFEMGALSTGRHDFYAGLGWERWAGPTYVRRGSDVVRTEDEDGGIMVLRFGPSNEVDLSASISCEQRRGDDW